MPVEPVLAAVQPAAVLLVAARPVVEQLVVQPVALLAAVLAKLLVPFASFAVPPIYIKRGKHTNML